MLSKLPIKKTKTKTQKTVLKIIWLNDSSDHLTVCVISGACGSCGLVVLPITVQKRAAKTGMLFHVQVAETFSSCPCSHSVIFPSAGTSIRGYKSGPHKAGSQHDRCHSIMLPDLPLLISCSTIWKKACFHAWAGLDKDKSEGCLVTTV